MVAESRALVVVRWSLYQPVPSIQQCECSHRPWPASAALCVQAIGGGQAVRVARKQGHAERQQGPIHLQPRCPMSESLKVRCGLPGPVLLKRPLFGFGAFNLRVLQHFDGFRWFNLLGLCCTSAASSWSHGTSVSSSPSQSSSNVFLAVPEAHRWQEWNSRHLTRIQSLPPFA